VRLRCYLPSTSAIVVIVVVGILLLHGAASHTFAAAGLATMTVMGIGLAGLVVSAVLIRRRQAAAGACHACSHPCREAIVPLPGLDAPQWPHRPLSHSALGARRTDSERGRATTLSPVWRGNSRAAETAGS
jgi:hypothetical protein